MTTLKYRDYIGSIEVDIENNCLFGKVLCVNGAITYEAETPEQLELEFQAAVEEYLLFCEEEELEPEVSVSGSFNVRTGPELHLALKKYAALENIGLNEAVKRGIELLVQPHRRHTVEIHHAPTTERPREKFTTLFSSELAFGQTEEPTLSLDEHKLQKFPIIAGEIDLEGNDHAH